MSDHPFLAGTHLERLETEDMSLHLYERHVAREFPDVIETAAVHMLIGIILQQVTKVWMPNSSLSIFFLLGPTPGRYCMSCCSISVILSKLPQSSDRKEW